VPEVIQVEFVTQVARIDEQIIDKPVANIRTEVTERIVEVPVNILEERLVEVPQVQTVEVIKQVGIEQYQDVPKHIPKYETKVVERQVIVARELIEEVLVEAPQMQQYVQQYTPAPVTTAVYAPMPTQTVLSPAASVGMSAAPFVSTVPGLGSYTAAPMATSYVSPAMTTAAPYMAQSMPTTVQTMGYGSGYASPGMVATSSLAPVATSYTTSAPMTMSAGYEQVLAPMTSVAQPQYYSGAPQVTSGMIGTSFSAPIQGGYQPSMPASSFGLGASSFGTVQGGSFPQVW